jgi:hypothetical protein
VSASLKTPLRFARALAILLPALFCGPAAKAQEPPYFVTYSQVLEEPGNLEIALKSLAAAPKDANAFYSPTLELEYGATPWWTTEVYLQGQSTANDSTIFTGFRWENRFRLIPRELPVNPLFYIEYEDKNAGDKSLLEVMGHDSISDLQITNAQGHREVEREVEMKLLLSSYVKSWNISENFIAEKNVKPGNGEPWEFGYALGVSRPLANYGNCSRKFSRSTTRSTSRTRTGRTNITPSVTNSARKSCRGWLSSSSRLPTLRMARSMRATARPAIVRRTSATLSFTTPAPRKRSTTAFMAMARLPRWPFHRLLSALRTSTRICRPA